MPAPGGAGQYRPAERDPVSVGAPNPPLVRTTVAGNSNEALDLLAEAVLLPPLGEGELLAFLNTCGYGAAMSPNHRARGQFAEWLLV